MSPASYRAAPPRVGVSPTLHRSRRGHLIAWSRPFLGGFLADPADVPSAELHALGQRQFGGVVDRVRRPAHIRLPGVRAGFATAAGVFLAAERAADLRARGADIDIRDSAIRSVRG